MEIKNLLEFLNKAQSISALDYAKCNAELPDFLNLTFIEGQFVNHINLGVIYISENNDNKFVLIDGLNRLLSLSLLLHAICECYKKTSEKNDKAVQIIRSKYLLNNTKTKLRLPPKMQMIYDKIIYGERLSGIEKNHPIFVTLHKYWVDIKENKLQAINIFNILQKLTITVVTADNINPRDLYYSINHNQCKINQSDLIEDYLKDFELNKTWQEIKKIYDDKNADLVMFFKDFYRNKFNYKEFKENLLYEYFVNYFQVMLKYQKGKDILEKIKHSAKLYLQLINVDIQDNDIKNALIKLKFHNCEDAYAYLLTVYEDYTDEHLSKATFLEILEAIDEYLKSRENTPNNVGFNELIRYLNAFIAYK